MTLKSNALVTVDELITSMGSTRSAFNTQFFGIYNSSSDATAATVGKTGTTLTLTVTGGANAGTSTFALTNASYDTITELVAAIEALSKGWVVNRLCAGAQSSADLLNIGATSCLASTQELVLQGFGSLALEMSINSVSAYVEQYCRKKFVSATYTEYYDCLNSRWLRLNQYPVTALTSVTEYMYDTQTELRTLTNHLEYEAHLTAGMIYRAGGWGGVGHKHWKIVYTAGYSTSDMPEDLKGAVMALCVMRYNDIQAGGIKSESIGGYSYSRVNTVDSEGAFGTGIPHSITAVFDSYRRLDHNVLR